MFMGDYMYSHPHSQPSLTTGYQSLKSNHINNYLSPRLNNSQHELLKHSTASFRSTRSSMYSQSSKLQKSSIFQRVSKNNEIDSVAKRLEQKQGELESLKSTTTILKQKVESLEKQLGEQIKNARQQSRKLRGCLNQFYNN